MKPLLILSIAFFCVSVATAQVADTTAEAKSETISESLPKAAYDTTTISFKDTDLRDIFRALAYQHKLNISVENNVVKKTTISLNRVPVYDAMKFLCEQNNLDLKIEGGIFRISLSPVPVVVKEQPKLPHVTYENGNLYLEVKNADLELLVLAIQNKTNKNILITSGTSGNVTGKLIDINFDLGFTQLLNNNGFAVQKKNNIYIVSRLDYFVGTQTTGQQQGQKAGPYWISVKDSSVTIDVTNAPLERIITDISRQLNTDVVFYNAVTGTVTARATNVNLSKAFDLILRNTNFTYRESDGIFFVGEKANKAMVSTRLFKLKYLRSEKFLDLVPQSISSQATLKVMKEHNGIVAIAANDVANELEDFIAQIDKPVAQVLIEAIVVDFNLTDGNDLGMRAGIDSTSHQLRGVIYPGVDITFGTGNIKDAFSYVGNNIGVANLGKLPANLYVSLQALEQKGLANVRSRPLIATLNGYPASLSIGTTQYYLLKSSVSSFGQQSPYLSETQRFETIEANVKLDITPYVGADGLITVEIKPDFKTPVGTLSETERPTINQRSMSSTVIMKEGETIVLGGMIEESESESRSQVPLLGDIPWLGSLFSSTSKLKRKTELIIYVTPHISYGEAFQNVYLPGKKEGE